MFDAGFLEMMVVAVIALLIVGPERLPGIARKVGEFIGKAKAFVSSTRSDIEKELHAEELKAMLSRQEKEINDLKDMVQDTQQSIHKEAKALNDDMKAELDVKANTHSDVLTDSNDNKKT